MKFDEIWQKSGSYKKLIHWKPQNKFKTFLHLLSKVSRSYFFPLFVWSSTPLWLFLPGISIQKYRKIPKISPGAYIFQRPFLRGSSTEGNLRFKLDAASLIVGSKFTIFFFVLLCIWGQFSKYKPPGGFYLEGLFNGGFFCITSLGGLYLERLIHGGAYIDIVIIVL